MNHTFRLTEHKYFEVELDTGPSARFGTFPFEVGFRVSDKVDHGGVRFILGIRGLFYLCLSVYDHRHWNHEMNCWVGEER